VILVKVWYAQGLCVREIAWIDIRAGGCDVTRSERERQGGFVLGGLTFRQAFLKLPPCIGRIALHGSRELKCRPLELDALWAGARSAPAVGVNRGA